MNRLTVLALLPAVALIATGCGQSESTSEPGDSLPDASIPAVVTEPASPDTPVDPATDDLAGDQVVFVWTETGGCAMGGPNCARYEVTVDGTVSTTRAGADVLPEPEAIGQVDLALVQAWRDALAGEDLDALRERAGEGEMTAAFDGVDFVVANPVSGVELSSVATNFDETEPVFATAFALAHAAAAAAPLEIEMR